MTLGYLSVQSSPVLVRSCTRPLSMRAAMRKPSSLISCSHCGPDGGFSTGWESCGGDERRKGDASARRTGLDDLRGRTLDDTRHARPDHETPPGGWGQMRVAVRPLSLRMAEQAAEVLAAGMVGWWTQLSWTCCNRERSRPRAERGRGARVGSAAIASSKQT